MRNYLLLLLGLLVVAGAAAAGLLGNKNAPATLFDYAFDLMEFKQLKGCPEFEAQYSLFLTNRGELKSATASEIEALEDHWNIFIGSDRGETPGGCEWTIEPYPAGFIATGKHTVIVINPSNTVVGAVLPDGTTGDLVMDATRYSNGSLGSFRGAATIPPRSIAIINLR